MCFGSTQQAKPVAAAGVISTITTSDYSSAAAAIDGEFTKAVSNKKGKRTEDAFDVLGTLIRARRDNHPARINTVLDEYVRSLR